ncbi:hypothetical protein MHYP_G00066860 [Metynnis hypsauchen]
MSPVPFLLLLPCWGLWTACMVRNWRADEASEIPEGGLKSLSQTRRSLLCNQRSELLSLVLKEVDGILCTRLCRDIFGGRGTRLLKVSVGEKGHECE